MAGRRVFRAAAADAMQKDVETAIATITEKGTFTSEAEREGVLGLYRRALATLSRWRADGGPRKPLPDGAQRR